MTTVGHLVRRSVVWISKASPEDTYIHIFFTGYKWSSYQYIHEILLPLWPTSQSITQSYLSICHCATKHSAVNDMAEGNVSDYMQLPLQPQNTHRDL